MPLAHSAKAAPQPSVLLPGRERLGNLMPSGATSDEEEPAQRTRSNMPPEAPAPDAVVLVAMVSGLSGAVMGFLLAGAATPLVVGVLLFLAGGIGGWTAARVCS